MYDKLFFLKDHYIILYVTSTKCIRRKWFQMPSVNWLGNDACMFTDGFMSRPYLNIF